jgi:hypothetical protein
MTSVHTIVERLGRLRDPKEFHAPGGCGADVPAPYEYRTELSLIGVKVPTCAWCWKTADAHPRGDRVWFRHEEKTQC